MDLAINNLPVSPGNLLSTDRIPYDRDLGGGNWITEYRTGSQITSAITILPTTSFTNINTSINNAITSAVAQVDNNFNIIGRDTLVGGSYGFGTTFFMQSTNTLLTNLQSNKIYTLKVRIYAHKTIASSSIVKCQEYNISIATDITISPFVQIIGGGSSTDFIFDHYDTLGANINILGFFISSSGKLRCAVNHNMPGEFISFFGYFTIV